MIATAWAAYQGYSAVRKWVPYAVGGVLGAILIAIPAYFIVTGARETAAAAIVRADIADQDAKRWFGKAQQLERDVAVQNEAAEAARADAAQSEAILATTDMLARAEAADLMAEISKWKERARANPAQTCTLGPLDRDAVRVLVGP